MLLQDNWSRIDRGGIVLSIVGQKWREEICNKGPTCNCIHYYKNFTQSATSSFIHRKCLIIDHNLIILKSKAYIFWSLQGSIGEPKIHHTSYAYVCIKGLSFSSLIFFFLFFIFGFIMFYFVSFWLNEMPPLLGHLEWEITREWPYIMMDACHSSGAYRAWN